MEQITAVSVSFPLIPALLLSDKHTVTMSFTNAINNRRKRRADLMHFMPDSNKLLIQDKSSLHRLYLIIPNFISHFKDAVCPPN